VAYHFLHSLQHPKALNGDGPRLEASGHTETSIMYACQQPKSQMLEHAGHGEATLLLAAVPTTTPDACRTKQVPFMSQQIIDVATALLERPPVLRQGRPPNSLSELQRRVTQGGPTRAMLCSLVQPCHKLDTRFITFVSRSPRRYVFSLVPRAIAPWGHTGTTPMGST
jgi:hypothetical protein